MKHFLKYLLAAGAFFSFLAISETIFIVNNRAEVIQSYYLILAKREASKNNIQKSLNLMSKAAEGSIEITAKEYPDHVQKNYPQVSYDPISEDFRKEYRKYFYNIPSLILIQDKTFNLSRIFYDLGLVANKSGEEELVIYFWQTAVFLVPQLSHYHVELANFYLRQEDEELVSKALEFCFNFEYANEHCRVYKDNNLFWKTPEEAGFLKEEVQSIYDPN